jgi:starvation-inducible DNA-binding protein
VSEVSLAIPSVSTNRLSLVAPALNALLADVFVLYFKTKNFHWHMSGPHFRDYHLLLDEQAAEIFAITDAIAERVRKIGAATLHSLAEVERHRRLEENDRRSVPAAEMIAELHRDNVALVSSLHELKQIVDEAGDNATSGLVDTWTDEAEQRCWFLFETGRAG